MYIYGPSFSRKRFALSDITPIIPIDHSSCVDRSEIHELNTFKQPTKPWNRAKK